MKTWGRGEKIIMRNPPHNSATVKQNIGGLRRVIDRGDSGTPTPRGRLPRCGRAGHSGDANHMNGIQTHLYLINSSSSSTITAHGAKGGNWVTCELQEGYGQSPAPVSTISYHFRNPNHLKYVLSSCGSVKSTFRSETASLRPCCCWGSCCCPLCIAVDIDPGYTAVKNELGSLPPVSPRLVEPRAAQSYMKGQLRTPSQDPLAQGPPCPSLARAGLIGLATRRTVHFHPRRRLTARLVDRLSFGPL